MMRTLALLLIGVAVLAGMTGKAAGSNLQPGTSANGDDIVIGQSADLSGQHAHVTRPFLAGAHAYFAQVNNNGGIHGRRIRLITMDDGNNPLLAIQNTQQLLQADKALALFGYVGWKTSSVVQSVVNESGAPFFAPVTGNSIVYKAFNRHVFTIRASYTDEYMYLFSRFPGMGLKRVAMFTEEDGATRKTAIQAMIRASPGDIELVAAEEGAGQDMKDIAGNLIQSRPDIVLIMSISQAFNTALIKAMRAKGYHGYFYSSSLVYSSLLNSPQEIVPGLIVSQVMPFPWKAQSPIVREYQQAMRKLHVDTFSYLGLEGFIAAKVLTEGIKRAGRAPTREKLIAALESINEHNYKNPGYRINFSDSNHHGSTYVDLTTITRTGAFIH
ncbi:ABC transporter substrate-binding protein [Herbaspirillum chlorophenolicum]|uniref:ABC transporter substrate-binding protein n=1 Tax=Herbaspirillum chlorophenolicum TaxID=211589 RepID=UPI00067B5085|nr:ABC transporter substrate-binding protein [Herbaspirillum chlorophenolicum]